MKLLLYEGSGEVRSGRTRRTGGTRWQAKQGSPSIAMQRCQAGFDCCSYVARELAYSKDSSDNRPGHCSRYPPIHGYLPRLHHRDAWSVALAVIIERQHALAPHAAGRASLAAYSSSQ